MHSLKIVDLWVNIDDKPILKGFDLEIKTGEIHAIMGPNGTGKSTLTKIIMGDSNYKIIKGDIIFDGESILSLSTDERSRLGIFLGMQNPIEIEGVSNADFLRSAKINRPNFKLYEFIKELNTNIDYLNMNKEMIHRSLNVGFSGGEKKKNEILQMYMLKPNTILLDEIDSGLDVDSLKIVGNAVMNYYNKNESSILLVTHYKRLLDYIKPDFVHIMNDGKIIKTGDINLAKYIEDNGYKNSLVSSTSVIKELEVNE